MTAEIHTSEPTAPLIRLWFERALAIAPDQQAKWLHEQCPNQQVRQSVLALLEADRSQTDPLRGPVGEWMLAFDDLDAVADASRLVGRSIGGFRLLHMLGQGGMSSVFLASREHADFHQNVALKLLKNSIFSVEEQNRFRRERQVLAVLEHPNIAHLIDGGVTDQGVPFLVMEFVDGEPITVFCREQGLNLQKRLLLFVEMCRAVDAAHRSLIVHRDIKPANVFVNRDGVVKLLDFGISKLLTDEDFGTRTIGGYFTPEYAAPEQIEGGKITTATDVYALGVVLHEILLGIRPEFGKSQKPSALLQTRRDLPSMPGQTQRSFQQALRGDLDNVILKATSFDANLRYRNAGDLADDVQRFLDGQAVTAHPPSGWYRTRKFLQRHKGAVGVTLALVLAVLASLITALWQAREARIQARLAQSEAARANEVKTFMLDLFAAAQENLPQDERPTPDVLVKHASQRLHGNSTLAPESKIDLLLALSQVGLTSGAYPESLAMATQAKQLLSAQSSDAVRLQATVLQADAMVKTGKNDEAIAALEPHMLQLRTADSEIAINGLVVRAQAAANARDAPLAMELADLMASRGAMVYGNNTREAITLALAPGRVRGIVGDPVDARDRLDAGLKSWRESGVSLDDEYASTLSALAVSQFRTGQTEAGLRSIDEAIALLRSLHEKPTATLITNLGSRASMLMETRQRDLGADDSRLALEAAEQLYGPHHPDTLTALYARAIATSRFANPQTAEPLMRELLARCDQSQQTAKNSTCMRGINALAMNLIRQKRAAEAEPFTLQALSLRRAQFGEHHPEYAMAVNALGNLRTEQQRFEEALAYFDQALLILREAKAPENINFAQLTTNRAKALRELKRHAEAASAFAIAKDLYDRLAPSDVRTRFQVRALLAVTLQASGDPKAAQTIAAEARALGDAKLLEALYPADRKAFQQLQR